MDQIENGQHVWLRSRVHGTYLHADEDGHGVSLSPLLESMNSAWFLQRNHEDDQHVFLHSAAYGRYLAATATSAPLGCSGFRVEQKNCDEPQDKTIRWHAIRTRPRDDFVILRNTAADGNGYLRANGKHLRWNEAVVSVHDIDDMSSMMEWVVVPIASSDRVPRLPRPNRLSLCLAERLALMLSSRVVVTQLCPRLAERLSLMLSSSREVEVFERLREEIYTNTFSFVFSGRSLLHLKKEVASRLSMRDDLDLYVRAGRYGRFTPLVVDLPRSGERLTITAELPANMVLLYPEFDAE